MNEEIPNNDDVRQEILEKSIEDNDLFADDNIADALDDATSAIEKEKKSQEKAMKQKASKKRKDVNKTKKAMGIRNPKQSKYSTRAHTFLKEPISDRAVHIVLNNQMTKIYMDGVDLCPRILMGIPAFGKKCTKNVYEHLITVQEKIKDARGEDPTKAPKWIILSNDTSMLLDRNLLSRLEELSTNTYAAGGYGFERIRASGKWYQLAEGDQEFLKGCYIQSSMDNTEWDFIVGRYFKNSPKYRVMIIHGPFIAVRGEIFMTMDFTDMAANMKGGFFHYMADISMECLKRKANVAQIKTVSAQFENINDMVDESDFQHDQSYFASKWQPLLPASVR